MSEKKTTIVGTPVSLVEWLLTHSDPKPVPDLPGWFYSVRFPEDTGAPYFEISIRHRDGRELSFDEGLYTRAIDGTPWNVGFSWVIQKALHEMYPDEYDMPGDPTPHLMKSDLWEPKIHLDAALQALLDGDMNAYDIALRNAARAMGVEVA